MSLQNNAIYECEKNGYRFEAVHFKDNTLKSINRGCDGMTAEERHAIRFLGYLPSLTFEETLDFIKNTIKEDPADYLPAVMSCLKNVAYFVVTDDEWRENTVLTGGGIRIAEYRDYVPRVEVGSIKLKNAEYKVFRKGDAFILLSKYGEEIPVAKEDLVEYFLHD
jgi:hypothetical protein